MRANRGRDTGPEMILRRQLRELGMSGYRLNHRIGNVRPDITFGRARVAVFVHGCFWHQCPTCRLREPTRNSAFWRAKFAANRRRDERNARALRDDGWSVIVVWGHELEGKSMRAAEGIVALVRRRIPLLNNA